MFHLVALNALQYLCCWVISGGLHTVTFMEYGSFSNVWWVKLGKEDVQTCRSLCALAECIIVGLFIVLNWEPLLPKLLVQSSIKGQSQRWSLSACWLPMRGAMLCKRIYHSCVPQTGSFSPDNMQAVRAQRSNNVVAQCMDLLQHNLDVQVLCNTSYFLWSDPEKPWRQ